MDTVEFRLAAQRALLGAVTQGLRSVSIEIDGSIARWRCIFESEAAKEQEWEELAAAAGELCADLDDDVTIDEEYLVVGPAGEMQHLGYLVYKRFEAS